MGAGIITNYELQIEDSALARIQQNNVGNAVPGVPYGDMRKIGGIPMEMMERGTISEMALEGQKRGMSYGQYVAARYYPVTVVQVLPDGGEIVRSAALPPIVPGWEKARERMRRRVGDGVCRSSKPQKKPKAGRQCVVCGEILGRYQRKYCGDGCRVKLMEAQGRNDKSYKLAKRVEKPCAVCGKLMREVLPSQKYCGQQCRSIGSHRKQREWAAAHPEEKKERYCRVCGIRIEGSAYKYCPNCAVVERNRDRHKR